MKGPRPCAHCGRQTGDYDGGRATVNGLPVCHPNTPDRPDCYRLITVYGQTLGHPEASQ